MRRFLVVLFCVFAIASIENSCQNEGRNSNRRGGQDATGEESTEVVAQGGGDTIPCIKPKVNVYIENSSSMDGFVNGITEFKDVIGNLLVNLKYFYDEDNIQIFFIRNERARAGQEEELVIKKACESDIADFARAIDLSWKNDGNRGQNTNLNNIFRTILDSTQNNTISILISDCIYSIGNGSTVNLLNQEKNTTYDAFLTKFKRTPDCHFATMVVKMMSDFDGRYFPYTGDCDNFPFREQLPYYICVISEQGLLKQFNKDIILKQDADGGFKNKYIISNEKSSSIYYSILLSTDNVGRFRPQRTYSEQSYVHGIEAVEMSGQGSGCTRRSTTENRPLQFAVAVDLSGIDIDESYFLEPKNYSLSDGNFLVKEILPIDKNSTSPGDWVRISKASSLPTHKIILEATGTAYSDLTISLKKQMPSWIRESSIMDDTRAEKIMGGNSFGLQFWVEGIAEAYEKAYKDNKSYFDIDIKIKR